MKKAALVIIALFVLSLCACNVQNIDTEAENPLFAAEYNEKEVIEDESVFSCGFVEMEKDAFKILTSEQFKEFLIETEYDHRGAYDWFYIDFKDGTGIVFDEFNINTGVYGYIEKSGKIITEILKFKPSTDITPAEIVSAEVPKESPVSTEIPGSSGQDYNWTESRTFKTFEMGGDDIYVAVNKISKSVFKAASAEDFNKLLTIYIPMEKTVASWYTIDFGDGTGLFFAGCIPDIAVYGELDEYYRIEKEYESFRTSGVTPAEIIK